MSEKKIMTVISTKKAAEQSQQPTKVINTITAKSEKSVADRIKNSIGKKFYHIAYGNVYLRNVVISSPYPIIIQQEGSVDTMSLTKDGKMSEHGEVVFYPSKDERDWTKYNESPTPAKIVTTKTNNPTPLYDYKPGDYIVTNGKKCIFDKYSDDHKMINTFVAMVDQDDVTNEQTYIRANDATQYVLVSDDRPATADEIKQIDKRLADIGLKFDPSTLQVTTLKWFPKYGELYYFIKHMGLGQFAVKNTVWNDSNDDKLRSTIKNVFQTLDEAKIWVEKYNTSVSKIKKEMMERE